MRNSLSHDTDLEHGIEPAGSGRDGSKHHWEGINPENRTRCHEYVYEEGLKSVSDDILRSFLKPRALLYGGN